MNRYIPEVTAVTFTQFKELIEPFDEREDQKSLIQIRQTLKHAISVRYRKKKLDWVIKLIKSLEFTKKSRGAKSEPNYDLDDFEFEKRNR